MEKKRKQLTFAEDPVVVAKRLYDGMYNQQLVLGREEAKIRTKSSCYLAIGLLKSVCGHADEAVAQLAEIIVNLNAEFAFYRGVTPHLEPFPTPHMKEFWMAVEKAVEQI